MSRPTAARGLHAHIKRMPVLIAILNFCFRDLIRLFQAELEFFCSGLRTFIDLLAWLHCFKYRAESATYRMGTTAHLQSRLRIHGLADGPRVRDDDTPLPAAGAAVGAGAGDAAALLVVPLLCS